MTSCAHTLRRTVAHEDWDTRIVAGLQKDTERSLWGEEEIKLVLSEANGHCMSFFPHSNAKMRRGT